MNHKLGALALVGASAVVLAGCAGGSGSAPSEAATGDLTVWLVGADTPAKPLSQPSRIAAVEPVEARRCARIQLLHIAQRDLQPAVRRRESESAFARAGRTQGCAAVDGGRTPRVRARS